MTTVMIITMIENSMEKIAIKISQKNHALSQIASKSIYEETFRIFFVLKIGVLIDAKLFETKKNRTNCKFNATLKCSILFEALFSFWS